MKVLVLNAFEINIILVENIGLHGNNWFYHPGNAP